MLRLLAVFVGVAMLSASWPAAMLHVHAYATHDHPEHHHGPERHVHAKNAGHHVHGVPSALDHDAARLEGCDPGEHAITLRFTCVSPTGHSLAVLGATLAPILPHPPERRGCLAPSDVRAHSPPARTGTSPRAPPLAFLA